MNKQLNLVIFGPQGSGKGTQAKLLAEKFGVPHISTGEMFRCAMAAKSALGNKARVFMDAGKLVPDDITIGIVKEALARPETNNGFILDGFPRNVVQYEALKEFLAGAGRADLKYIFIELSEEEALARIAKRFVCQKCEAIYIGNPGKCKKCGGTSLIQRTDETQDAVRQRLQLFNSQTMPLVRAIEKDGQLIRVNGAPGIPEVHEEILRKLS
ncbi:adenylate kinase [bacterium]|nr:MAG: adenylate kinase [bacterium]